MCKTICLISNTLLPIQILSSTYFHLNKRSPSDISRDLFEKKSPSYHLKTRSPTASTCTWPTLNQETYMLSLMNMVLKILFIQAIPNIDWYSFISGSKDKYLRLFLLLFLHISFSLDPFSLEKVNDIITYIVNQLKKCLLFSKWK